MNGMKTEEAGSRKKYLAPLVVIMLCLVALTGAAYAYSSSISNTGNGFDGDYLSIDLATNTPGTDIQKISGAITFTDNYSYTASADKKDQVDCEIKTAKILTYDLKIVGDTKANKLTVNSSDIATLYTKSIGTATVSSLFKIYVNDSDTITGAKLLDNNDTATFTIDKAANANIESKVIYIFIQALDGASEVASKVTSVRAASAIGDPDHDAAWFANDLATNSDYQFSLKFIASQVDA